MIVRQYAPCSLGRSIICLGKQGEINALRVEFDVSAWMAMYPDATVKLMHFAPDRPQDNPVIPTLGVEGTLRVWIVGEEDTAGAGNGVIELLLIDERTGSTIKSATGYTTVLRSPSAGIEAQEAEAGYVRYDVDQSALLTDEQKAMARKNIGAGTGDETGSGGILKETDPTVPDWAKQPSKPTYTASEVGARPDTWTPTAADVGADAAGTASGAVAAHNTSGAAHADLRALIEGLTSRLNALADSDDTTLDQLSEIVAYIKSNRTLIDAVTTGKVSVSDIVDNLTTNASGKVLSAAQGVALKAMIDGIVIPTALPNPQPITINGQRYDGSEAVTVTVSSEGGGTPVEIDGTLTQSGKAADAKAVGDQLSALNEAIDNVQGTVINQNGGGALKIWAGTQAEYDALLIKDEGTVYLIDGTTTGGGSGEEQPTVYSITNNLTNVSNSNDATSAEAGTSYSATLTPSANHEMNSVSVFMGGTDVTDSVYSNKAISIASVTGNIVINAVAEYVSGGESTGDDGIYKFSNITTGKIDDSGNIIASSCYFANEFVEAAGGSVVLEGENVTDLLEVNVADYDANKNFISVAKYNGANIIKNSTGAKYRKFFWYSTNESEMQKVDSVAVMRMLTSNILSEDGTLDASGNVIGEIDTHVSGYIPFTSGADKYVIFTNSEHDPTKVAWYDSDKAFIERQYAGANVKNIRVCRVPVGAAYFRVCGKLGGNNYVSLGELR